jgi:hypothetical protein
VHAGVRGKREREREREREVEREEERERERGEREREREGESERGKTNIQLSAPRFIVCRDCTVNDCINIVHLSIAVCLFSFLFFSIRRPKRFLQHFSCSRSDCCWTNYL